jgi:hypothetical protein
MEWSDFFIDIKGLYPGKFFGKKGQYDVFFTGICPFFPTNVPVQPK